MLGSPTHDNVGDHLLWLAGKRLVRQHGYRLSYTASHRTFDPARLAGADVVVLAGGGNLGDRYGLEQSLREQAVDAARVPVVQLPQSVDFRQSSAEARWVTIAQRHGDVRVMIRDAASLDRGAGWGLRTVLAPDAAFAVRRLAAPAAATTERVLLLRQDAEAAVGMRPAVAFDWIDGADARPLRVARRLVYAPPRALRTNWRAHEAVMDAFCRMQLRRGLRLLARGRWVVTDRLHAHLIAVLMGRPTVLLDNAYGKNEALFTTWTQHLDGTHLAETVSDALSMSSEDEPWA